MGGRACGALTASPPGPCPCFGSPTGSRAFVRLNPWVLRLRILQEHQQKTWWKQGQAGEERGLLGKVDDSAVEWETPLESSEDLKGRRHKKLSRFNEPRWTIQCMTFRWDVPLTHAA
jgi:hypothetical protein